MLYGQYFVSFISVQFSAVFIVFWSMISFARYFDYCNVRKLHFHIEIICLICGCLPEFSFEPASRHRSFCYFFFGIILFVVLFSVLFGFRLKNAFHCHLRDEKKRITFIHSFNRFATVWMKNENVSQFDSFQCCIVVVVFISNLK